MRRPVLATAMLFAAVTSAVAEPYVETVTFDPDGIPMNGDECTIEFRAPVNTAVSRADVVNMRADFEFALANSPDMRIKVEDACLKHMDMLTIRVLRNDPDVDAANTLADGIVNIDPGDIEDMIHDLDGLPGDMLAVVDIQAIGLMAHEIDHNRDTGGDHDDPPVPLILQGKRGPAVKDENLVMEDLNTGIARYNYGRLGNDGRTKIDYVVSGRFVIFDLTLNLRARKALNRAFPPTLSIVGPSLILLNPGEPCVPGSSPTCYPLIADNDVDHDGVPDGIDNCIDLSNPQQGDSDFDGTGTGCDHDDDEDGTSGAIESGTGSIDHDASSLPEHWSCSAEPAVCGTTTDPCTDGIDNDLDGFFDLNDPGCNVPIPDGVDFPAIAQPGELLHPYRRPDTGGVSQVVEAFLINATVELDHDLNGTIDSTTTAAGVTVIQNNPAFDSGGGVRMMDGSVLDFSLHGTDPMLGDFVLHSVPGSQNPFQLTAKQAGSDFPANGRIDFEITLDTTTFGQLDEAVAGLQSSFVPWWQPFETTWNSFGAPMIFSDDGTPVVRIIDITLRFERDTDFDGAFDSADNCINDPNPGQGDADSDGSGDVCDCGAMDPTVQSQPPGLDLFFVDANTLIFSPDGLPGSQLDVLDVVRSGDATDFLTGAICVGADLPPWATVVTDTEIPIPGTVNYYLGQLENGCPGTQGEGPAGTASDGTEHQIRDCD